MLLALKTCVFFQMTGDVGMEIRNMKNISKTIQIIEFTIQNTYKIVK